MNGIAIGDPKQFTDAEARKIVERIQRQAQHAEKLFRRLQLTQQSRLKPKNLLRLLAYAKLIISTSSAKIVTDKAMLNASTNMINYVIFMAGKFL